MAKAQLARVGEEHLLKEIQLLQNKGKGDKRQLKKEKNKGYLVRGSVLAKKREERDEANQKKAQQPNQKRRKYKKANEQISGPILLPPPS